MAKPRAVMAYCGPGDLRHVKVSGQPQRLGQGRHAHAAQIFAADYCDRGGDISEALEASRGGRDVGVGELFDGQLFEFFELACWEPARKRRSPPRR